MVLNAMTKLSQFSNRVKYHDNFVTTFGFGSNFYDKFGIESKPIQINRVTFFFSFSDIKKQIKIQNSLIIQIVISYMECLYENE